MTTGPDPFLPRTPLSRELLERYAAGRLDPDEQHAVELHLEQDPLLREAAEGLRMPGATDALAGLRRPKAGHWGARLLGLAIIAGTIALLVAVLRTPEPRQQEVRALLSGGVVLEAQPVPTQVESTLAVVHAEIAASTALPPSPHAPRSLHDRFLRPDTVPPSPMPREPVERMDGTPVVVERSMDTAAIARVKRSTRPSRRLVFLHDLKVVHPNELYGAGGPPLPSPGVPADKADPAGRDAGRLSAEKAAMAYLDYMDGALGAFATGHQRTALDDLYFLLGQYPDDVNARFYAGLCCYDLGLLARARAFFASVKDNPVDSFNEEAAWYLALTIARMDGAAAARPAFERIAAGEGFYAAQARAKLH